MRDATEIPITVLLIDDSPLIGFTVEGAFLDSPKIDFHHCIDPKQALEQALKIQPTVILLDLKMPELDGLEVLAILRGHNATALVPIVVLSSQEDPAEKVAAFSTGADDYLVKLPHEAELLARVRYHSRSYLHMRQRDEAYKSLSAHKHQLELSNNLLLDLNKRLETASEELEAARDKALEASEAKSSFLANMSHEIRTPMNGIIGLTSVLMETKMDAKQHDYLGKVKFCAESLLGIINDILDFSKIEAGMLEHDPVEFSLRELVDNVFVGLEEGALAKGLELERLVEPSLPDLLIQDPLRLQQVLRNLLSNAIKFTERGQVRLRVSTQEQTPESAVLLFEVSDTGVGIPKEKLEAVFEAFTQADASTSRHHGGTGLGLAIVKNLVGMMGGEVWLESQSGEGSQFYFTVSCQRPQSENPSASAPGDLGTPTDNSLKVLLAEDNPINQVVMEEFLSSLGHQVRIANDGREAVEFFQERQFDLVLMDVQMPEMDGFEAVAAIRDKEEELHVPVIALTAFAMKGDRERCLAAGMDGYLSKPISLDDLKQAIQGLPEPSLRS